MLKVNVHSTDTGEKAYFEVKLAKQDERQVIGFLQTVGAAQAFGKLLEIVGK